MRAGVFAKTFSGTDPMTVLTAARAAGYTAVQYNFACSGLAPMPDTIDDAALHAIREAVDATGVGIAALSATYNMIHPDPAVRAKGLERLQVSIAAAAALSIPLVTLCTGTRDAEDQWRDHSDNRTPEAWADLVTEMRKAAALADAAGLWLGIEPEQANVIRDADDAVRLMAEVTSPALRIVLDPANLFEKASREDACAIVAHAVRTLGPRIALAHAKDRSPDGAFVTAGTGVVDFAAFVTELQSAGFDGALVTHGLSAEEAPDVARFLKTMLP